MTGLSCVSSPDGRLIPRQYRLRIERLCARRFTTPVSPSPPPSKALTITGAPEKRAQNIERLKLAVGLGHQIAPSKPPVIDTILGGKTPEWEKLKGPMADELSAWARVGQEHNATICFKPHAAQAVNNAERAIWLLKQVNSPSIRIIYDYSHFFVEGFGLAQSLQELFPYTAFISVKDSRGATGKSSISSPGRRQDGLFGVLPDAQAARLLRFRGRRSKWTDSPEARI